MSAVKLPCGEMIRRCNACARPDLGQGFMWLRHSHNERCFHQHRADPHADIVFVVAWNSVALSNRNYANSFIWNIPTQRDADIDLLR